MRSIRSASEPRAGSAASVPSRASRTASSATTASPEFVRMFGTLPPNTDNFRRLPPRGSSSARAPRTRDAVYSGGRHYRAPMATPPALLFDLDGTLIDSVYQHVLAWQEALTAFGID